MHSAQPLNNAKLPSGQGRSTLASWGFRCAALVLIPVAFLGCLEAGLRLCGYGYPTGFLRPFHYEGRALLAQNNQFSWRFFGRSMARTPYPIALPAAKGPGTIRIFVFGESAAYGDPQPRFGLARMLEAMLGTRYPNARFEIVNAAMTGINSHAILPITRDCAEADGDIWVIYMGNNEVVGPFGAGTVFGSPTPPLPLVRARLAALKTRSGQLLNSLGARLHPPPASETEWGGMKMFLERPVPAQDPKLAKVYRHFTRNLNDILEVARSREIRVVLSTVAVNLRDCGPFGSGHREDLPAASQIQWEQLYQKGVQQWTAGHAAAAAEFFAQAAQLDDRHAELRFRQGQCAVKLARPADAARHFEAARDLDTLRFRCDNELNGLIRRIAASRDPATVRLADAARGLEEASPGLLPGHELFCDHVHFTFEGTYLLAQTIAGQIEPLLPASIRTNGSPRAAWPDLDGCAQRLAWTDWNRGAFLQEVWKRQGSPPFTGQADHFLQMEGLRAQLNALRSARGSEANQRAQAATRAALTRKTQDPELHAQLAALCQEAGDLVAAESAAREAVRLLPTSNEAWAELGRVLGARHEYAKASGCFRMAIQLDGDDVWSMQNLGQALQKLGDNQAALREYRRALQTKPRFSLAWLGLGRMLEAQGDKSGAEAAYRQALANPMQRPAELLTVARFCRSRQWWDAAATHYATAIRLNPMDPNPYFELGQTLTAVNRHADAAKCYEELVRVAPELAEAHFLYGLSCGRLGRTTEAAAQFLRAAQLKPDLIEARLNLGIALLKHSQTNEALAEFEAVLQRDPTNAVALRHRDALRGGP